MNKKPITLQKMPAPRVEVINLIDVLITLIAFFMLTTVFANPNYRLEINLPRTEYSEKNKSLDGLVLELDKEERIYLNGKIIEGAALQSIIRKETTTKTTVSIRADKECRYEKVIQLLDLVRECDIKQVALMVSRE